MIQGRADRALALRLATVQFKDVYCLGVGAQSQEVALLAEGQTVDVGAALDAPSELHEPGAVLEPKPVMCQQ